MQQPIHLLDQMIVGFMEKAEDLDNVAHDKARSIHTLDKDTAIMYATAALTMRFVVAELTRIKGHYVSAFVDEMGDVLEEMKAQAVDVDELVAKVIPIHRPKPGGSDD